MKKIFVLLLFPLLTFSQSKKELITAIQKFQSDLNSEYKNPKETPLRGDNFDNFKNHLALSPEELLISEEDQKQILSIIESLDANYKDIIQLRFFEEKSIKEIAEELNLTVSNTKVRIMRAKKLLAELLKNTEFED